MNENKKLAADAFRSIAYGNTSDLERINDGVEIEICECLSLEYQRWLDAFQSVANVWAIEHWRLLAQLFAAQSGALEYRLIDPAKAEQFADSVSLCCSRYAALEIALERVGEEHGVSADAVRVFAGSDQEKAIRSSTAPDLDYLRDFMFDLERVLNPPPGNMSQH